MYVKIQTFFLWLLNSFCYIISDNLEGSGGLDLDLLAGGARVAAVALDLLDEVIAVNDLAEDDVLAIEPAGDNGGDEELGSVGVLSGVGHGKETGLGVGELEVLVLELLAVDGLSTSSIMLGEVTSLKHEVGDDTVEAGAGIPVTVLAGAELTEVPGGLGNILVVELEGDATGILAVNGDIEVDVGHFVVFVCRSESQRVLVDGLIVFVD